MRPSSGILRRAPSRRLPARRRYRGYHSIALLLPDGRVLSSGGDGEPNGEVFSPPYLFKGATAQITSVAADVSSTVFRSRSRRRTPRPSPPSRWSRLSTVTHSTNMNQRFLRLPFSQGSGGLTVTPPSAAESAPPGDYMLFLLNSTGVPSVGSIVRLGVGNPPAAPSNLTATAVSSNRINLAWTDNASTELGVRIERSIDGTHVLRIRDSRPERHQLCRHGRQPIRRSTGIVSAPITSGRCVLVGRARQRHDAAHRVGRRRPCGRLAFNEGSGSTATDVSGHATRRPSAIRPGRRARTARRSPSTACNTAVSIPDTNNSLDVSTLTVEAWLFKTSNDAGIPRDRRPADRHQLGRLVGAVLRSRVLQRCLPVLRAGLRHWAVEHRRHEYVGPHRRDRGRHDDADCIATVCWCRRAVRMPEASPRRTPRSASAPAPTTRRSRATASSSARESTMFVSMGGRSRRPKS